MAPQSGEPQGKKRRYAGPKLTPKDHRVRKYGMTAADYAFMLEFQQGQCGICKTHQSELPRALAVDHCHQTGRVRGLLCSKCNTALGLLKDSPEFIERAGRWIMEIPQ